MNPHGHTPVEPHCQALLDARRRFLDHHIVPQGLLDPLIVRSRERCVRFGLDSAAPQMPTGALDRLALKTEQHRHQMLLAQGRPIMEYLYNQIRASGSMVILANADGLVLHSVGDPDFVSRADRVSLTAGATWDENQRGTNAIGTALVEECPVEILGAEHFLEHNNFLTCAASPVFGPDGRLSGVLDISGDYRSYQRNTLALARFSAAILERQLFEKTHARDIIVSLHPDPNYLGSPHEGLAAVNLDSQVLAINRNALEMLGTRRSDAIGRHFSMVFECNLGSLIDRSRGVSGDPVAITVNGRQLYLKLGGQLPQLIVGVRPPPASRIAATPGTRPAPRAPAARRTGTADGDIPCLDSLDTGDQTMRLAIDRARRIIGRDIPVMIHGESGSGKEVFAKAFHHSGDRHKGAFIALNCAAIPETLIESELFGYQGGAFTGSRKEGAPGKIQLAHQGTLFLDEIGDMPLHLQARLLRVLQERSVTPLGSAKAMQVDISLVCATHRNLREEVARGNFREDLYYRINGLSITLPPLRARSDIRQLARQFVNIEGAERPRPVRLSEDALQVMEHYAWPGNIRQMASVIRVIMALLDDDEYEIREAHLPEELFENASVAAWTPPGQHRHGPAAAPAASGSSLEEMSRNAAQQALENAGGNVSAAARQLGISRNTLYRKLGRL